MKNIQFVAVDLETTGKYPFGSEICEVAMIKFDSTGVLDRFETLVCPKRGMGAESQKIHGLSMEDLQAAPSMDAVIPDMLKFIDGAPLVGHNLPFDLGFLSVNFDQFFEGRWWDKTLKSPNFCTSLISLETHPKLTSHRLKHLVEFFDVESSPNHRAMQDAQACMEVFLKLIVSCETLDELVALQKDELLFESFSPKLLKTKQAKLSGMIEACRKEEDFELMYSKGSRKNKWRTLTPKGLVLKTKNASFVVGVDQGETQTKRFMLDKILDTKFKKQGSA